MRSSEPSSAGVNLSSCPSEELRKNSSVQCKNRILVNFTYLLRAAAQLLPQRKITLLTLDLLLVDKLAQLSYLMGDLLPCPRMSGLSHFHVPE